MSQTVRGRPQRSFGCARPALWPPRRAHPRRLSYWLRKTLHFETSQTNRDRCREGTGLRGSRQACYASVVEDTWIDSCWENREVTALLQSVEGMGTGCPFGWSGSGSLSLSAPFWCRSPIVSDAIRIADVIVVSW